MLKNVEKKVQKILHFLNFSPAYSLFFVPKSKVNSPIKAQNLRDKRLS